MMTEKELLSIFPPETSMTFQEQEEMVNQSEHEDLNLK